jgi:uncharacterized protein
MITRRRFLKISVVTSGLGLGLYTWRCEPHRLETTDHALPVEHLPPQFVGKRMVQLSDLHIGPRVSDAYLIGVFDRVKSLSPDIVVYTGDFTSFEADVFNHASRLFAHLPLGRMATLGILGNHDYGRNWDQPEVADRLVEMAAGSGLRLLRNEAIDLAGLQIIGLDDLWAGRFDPGKAFARREPQTAALALSHNPDTVDLPGWEKHQGWILCGHTHGGQCKPPFLPPPLLPVKNRRYTAGSFQLPGNRRMYINRGVGHLLQVRFNARPEITVFHLEREPNRA